MRRCLGSSPSCRALTNCLSSEYNAEFDCTPGRRFLNFNTPFSVSTVNRSGRRLSHSNVNECSPRAALASLKPRKTPRSAYDCNPFRTTFKDRLTIADPSGYARFQRADLLQGHPGSLQTLLKVCTIACWARWKRTDSSRVHHCMLGTLEAYRLFQVHHACWARWAYRLFEGAPLHVGVGRVPGLTPLNESTTCTQAPLCPGSPADTDLSSRIPSSPGS